jgi:hypothetical protein
MKKITGNDLALWTKGSNINEASPILFVLVKTPSCPNCEALLAKSEIFGKFEENIAIYTHSNGKDGLEGSKVLAQVGVEDVPILLFRFQSGVGGSTWSVDKIIVDVEDDFINVQNVFDALSEKQFDYFGYNEYDEAIEDGAQFSFNRLLRLIYGEADPTTLKERQLLKREVTN